jgi:hypothetical protein
VIFKIIIGSKFNNDHLKFNGNFKKWKDKRRTKEENESFLIFKNIIGLRLIIYKYRFNHILDSLTFLKNVNAEDNIRFP